MLMIIMGVLLWSGVHFFKRLMPAQRAAMGDKAKLMVTVGSFAALALMIIGYRAAPVEFLWQMPPWAIPLNNLLMLIAIFLVGMSATTGRLRGKLRHPMLLGTVVWSVAHLMVNGDTASVVLFGGMGLWALIQMALVNRAGPWNRPDPGTAKKDIVLVVITVVMFAVITIIHGLIGPSPFG